MINLEELRDKLDNARAQVKVRHHAYDEAKTKLLAIEDSLKALGFDVSDMSTIEAQLHDMEKDAKDGLEKVERGLAQLVAAIG